METKSDLKSTYYFTIRIAFAIQFKQMTYLARSFLLVDVAATTCKYIMIQNDLTIHQLVISSNAHKLKYLTHFNK